MMKILKMGEVSAAEIFRRNTPTVNVTDTVAEILRKVRERGDAALREYTRKFDGADLENLLVTEAEMAEAVASVEPEFLRVLEKAAENIRKFHSRQIRNSFIINYNLKAYISARSRCRSRWAARRRARAEEERLCSRR